MRSFAHGRHGRYLESLRADPIKRSSWKLKNQHTLTVGVEGAGSVQRSKQSNDGRGYDVFELTATADPGWGFDGWNGNLNGKDNPAVIVVDDSKQITARFVRNH